MSACSVLVIVSPGGWRSAGHRQATTHVLGSSETSQDHRDDPTLPSTAPGTLSSRAPSLGLSSLLPGCKGSAVFEWLPELPTMVLCPWTGPAMASVACVAQSSTSPCSRGGCLHLLLSFAVDVPTGLGASQGGCLPATRCSRLVSDDPPPTAEASHPSGHLSESPCKPLLMDMSVSCGLRRPAASGAHAAGLGQGRSKKTWLGGGLVRAL